MLWHTSRVNDSGARAAFSARYHFPKWHWPQNLKHKKVKINQTKFVICPLNKLKGTDFQTHFQRALITFILASIFRARGNSSYSYSSPVASSVKAYMQHWLSYKNRSLLSYQQSKFVCCLQVEVMDIHRNYLTFFPAPFYDPQYI